MDKQKQIAEMAKVIEQAMAKARRILGGHNNIAMFYATMLINEGYRKIPEGAVVLTREELADMKFTQEHCDLYLENKWLKECIPLARKETVEKFAEMANERIAQRQGERDGYEAFTIDDKAKYDGDIVSLALFEILKEIMEGEQGKLDEQKNCIYEQRKELDFVWWECSACGSGFNFYANTPYENRFHYCPYCGAKIAECKELQNERND